MFEFLDSVEERSVIYECLCKRAFFYIGDVLNSPHYERQKTEVISLLALVLNHISPDLIKSSLFSDRDRENYMRFKSLSCSMDREEIIPMVSIILPCLNSEKHLSECLDSLVYQTLRDIEIICVDMGSNDYTRYLLQEYAADDNRIKLLFQENDDSFGKAVNDGIRMHRVVM